MNIQLEKLFEVYHFSLKDRYDFLQIYRLLPDFKKVKVIESFEEIAYQLDILHADLHAEQEILFGKTLENIEMKLERIQKSYILQGSTAARETLRSSF